jgi:hypothetical protein
MNHNRAPRDFGEGLRNAVAEQLHRTRERNAETKRALIRRIQELIESRWEVVLQNVKSVCSNKHVVNMYGLDSSSGGGSELLVVSAGKVECNPHEEAVLSEFIGDVEERISRRLGCTVSLSLTNQTGRDPATGQAICQFEIFVTV